VKALRRGAPLILLVTLLLFGGLLLAWWLDHAWQHKAAGPQEGPAPLALYLLDKKMTAAEASQFHPAALPLQKEPLLSLEDLLAYDPQTCRLALTHPAALRLEELSVPVSGLPFIVTLHGQPRFLGTFWTSFSSLSYDEAVVIDVLLVSRDGILRLDLGYPASSGFFRGFDWRRDPDFLQVLADAGLLAQP
jgi:hypothetical protein